MVDTCVLAQEGPLGHISVGETPQSGFQCRCPPRGLSPETPGQPVSALARSMGKGLNALLELGGGRLAGGGSVGVLKPLACPVLVSGLPSGTAISRATPVPPSFPDVDSAKEGAGPQAKDRPCDQELMGGWGWGGQAAMGACRWWAGMLLGESFPQLPQHTQSLGQVSSPIPCLSFLT